MIFRFLSLHLNGGNRKASRVDINPNYLIMKKSILNLGKSLSKAEQINITGGLRPSRATCAQTCVTAPHGTPCGPPHCPGMCTGNGGYVNY